MPFDASPSVIADPLETKALNLLKKARNHLVNHPEQWCRASLYYGPSIKDASRRCVWGTVLWLAGYDESRDVRYNQAAMMANKLFPDMVPINDRQGREAVISNLDRILASHNIT